MKQTDVPGLNQSTWATPNVLAEFAQAGSTANLASWTDAGELAVTTAVASEARGTPILDVGVGGGRTSSILRLLSDDYLGIDFMPEMIAEARRNHPDLEFQVGDARELAGLESDHYGLVVFSFNGIDAVSHDDRRLVLHQLSRVVAPGGLVVYSTHNLDGPCFRARPWRRAGSPAAHSWTLGYRVARAAQDLARSPVRVPRSVANRRRLARDVVRGPDWAIAPVEAHDFGLLVHYTTLPAARAELDAAGFEPIAAFDAELGRAIPEGADVTEVRYFHLAGRKR